MASDVQKQVWQYMQLLQQGMPARDAFNQAFPNGLPTAQDRAKEAAAAQQSQAWGQVGGLAAGALGTKAVVNAVTGKPVLGSLGGKLSGLFGGGAPVTEVAGAATPSLSTPAILSGSRVVPVGTSVNGGTLMSNGTVIPPESAGWGLSNTLGALGALKGGYDVISGFEHGGKGMRTGTTELGAGIGTMILPGIGTVVGAGLGNLVGGLAKRMGLFHKTTKQRQAERTGKLLKQGIPTYESYLAQSRAGKDAARAGAASQAADFIGFTPSGQFVNNKFRTSRSEADLMPEDIWGSHPMFEKFGNDWLGSFSEDQRRRIAAKALQSGAVNEKYGMIYVDWNKVGDLSDIIGKKKEEALKDTPANRATLKQNAQAGQSLLNAMARR